MPDSTNDQLERFYARDRQEWRAWLEQNAATAKGVWLIYYKQNSNQPRVSYDEAVEEALCFGWIDSRPNTLDDERYMQLFSPRKPKSPWSKSNKQRVEKLIQQGLMTAAGLKAIEIAKKNGMWNVYDAIEALTMPEDLREALVANNVANANFEAFSNSTKKQLLWWVESAKRPETRSKRIQQIVLSAEQNKNPLNYAANKKS
ncbi:MAG TPA: YdeI/OmpD-associated family protein [Ktedonobacteraceae bacterium]|nr:YdeI/OmpD-associated family protein [Ktedonobacteraceae bacterium]